jgi:hypothetical protein
MWKAAVGKNAILFEAAFHTASVLAGSEGDYATIPAPGRLR